MHNPKIRFNHKRLFACYTIWLFISFIMGFLFREYLDTDFLRNFLFIKANILKDSQIYLSIMLWILLLSPFVFIYIYKSCILTIRLDRKMLWLPLLIAALGLFWNMGAMTISTTGHYKYDLLARYLIQEFDWIAAIFISWFGLFLALPFSAVVLIFYIKGNVDTT